MQQCNFNARSFVCNFKLQLDYVSTSMFEKMHAAPAFKALLFTDNVPISPNQQKHKNLADTTKEC